MPSNPGWRRAPNSLKGGGPSFSKAAGKRMWATFSGGFFFFTNLVKPKADSNGDQYEQDQEPGPDVIVYLPLSSNQTAPTYILNLTDLTHDEYVNLRKILATALKEAEPIIKVRDADAARKLQAGQIAPPRAYRAISRLFTPEGEVE